MKNLLLLFSCVFFASCFRYGENPDHRLTLDQKEVRQMIFQCGDNLVSLDSEETALLVNKINSAIPIGPVKGIVRQNLIIYLHNNDTIKMKLLGNKFKWNKSGDWAYEVDFDETYFEKKCALAIDRNNNLEATLKIQNPIQTIERIFNRYNTAQESTDSQSNLDSLKQSLKILETTPLNANDLKLIVNVWMYYTVTDFSTVKYTKNVLFAHKEQSIIAVEQRIANKMNWETTTGAPYSELPLLLEELNAAQNVTPD